MTSDKDFISELQKLKSYKEVSALQTIKALILLLVD